MSRVRRAVAAAAGLALLTGCSVTNQITTQLQYSASDGARVTLGDDIRGLNLIVLTEAQGSPGVLIGAVANQGAADVVVRVDVSGAGTAEVAVPAGRTVLITGEDTIVFEAVAAAPGTTLPIALSTGTVGSAVASVPVLDGTLPEYAEAKAILDAL